MSSTWPSFEPSAAGGPPSGGKDIYETEYFLLIRRPDGDVCRERFVATSDQAALAAAESAHGKGCVVVRNDGQREMQCYPIGRGPAESVTPLARSSRFGGAPWLSPRSAESSNRPRDANQRPLDMILQLALDDLPTPPPFGDLLLQLFATHPRSAFGATLRLVDASGDDGMLAPSESAWDASASAMHREAAITDVPHYRDHLALTHADGRSRPHQVTRLFGFPFIMTSASEANFGTCADCKKPLEVLLHLEGSTMPEFTFGDTGWLVIGWCRDHPWSLFCATHQVP